MLPFDSLFVDETRRGTKIKTDDYLASGTYPIVDQGQSLIAGYTNLEEGVFCNVPAVIFGDHTRAIKYIDEPFFLGADGTKILKSKDSQTNEKYLYYALRAAKIPNLGYSRHFKCLKELKFKTHSRNEQDKIVTILDNISKQIDLNNQKIKQLDELVKARFVEMFGDGFETTELRNICKTTSGGTPSTKNPDYYNGTIPWVTTTALGPNHIDGTKAKAYISEEAVANSATKIIPSGSILFGIRVGVGKTSINDVDICTNQDIVAIMDVNETKFSKLFIKHVLDANRAHYDSLKKGATILGITSDDLKNTPIPLAPIKAQKDFETFVEQVDKSKFTLQKSIISLMNLCSLWYNMSNMFSSGYMGRLELIRALPTKEEKAKASRLVLREVLEQIFPEKSAKKKKKYSLLELIDCSPIRNYVNDDQVTESLHFIRIIGIRAEHNQPVREKDVKIAVDNLEYFIKFLDNKNNTYEEPTKSPEYFSEAETRAAYIDMYLREAGWDVLTQKGVALPGKAGIEIEVGNMPNNADVGYCDYVLYDRAGKPLAVVEAKKTSKDPQIGRHQADLYAESLKEKFGYKPVIYYTNGYETHVIDGVYPDRKVTAFHTLEELERMIQRRNHGNITDMAAKDEIAGRPYQKMALTRMCERFNAHHRRGLVVMATGTGKTRVSIALTDILARNG